MHFIRPIVSLPRFTAIGRQARRFLPLAVVLSWPCVLSAQDLAAKFYPAPNSAGGSIYNTLVQAPDGNFYGAGGEAIVRLDDEGESTNVYGFSTVGADGYEPVGGLLLGQDGNLYGLTSTGGTLGLGTVYQFNPATGAVQTIANLNATPENFGFPAAYLTPLVQDRAGNFFYLSATYTSTTTSTTEVEEIMQVTPGGAVFPLHVFSPPDADGKNPEGFGANSGLVIDGQGNLYGFTDGGGAGSLGTFYEVTPSGQATALYSYDADGTGVDNTPVVPDSRVNSIVAAADGTVYGVAYNLGDPPVSGGPGVGTINGGGIFRANGGQPEPLYVFSSGVFQEDGSYINADGVDPSSLSLGPDGNLYGVTDSGGANGGGTVFMVTPSGAYTLLYTLPASPAVSLYAAPVLSTDGDLFGPCGSDLGAFYRLGATLLPEFNAPTLKATATQGVQFSLQLVAANDPDTFTASGLPAGLSLDAATGLITGATTAPVGTYPVALGATNPDGSSTATLTITVQVSPDAPVLTPPSKPLAALINMPFSYQIVGTHKPTYHIEGLPAGVNYNPKTGLVEGLFKHAGEIMLQVQAQNASGKASESIEIDVTRLPKVTVSGDSPDADAVTGQAGAFVISLSDASGADLNINYTVGGNAKPGVEYKPLEGTLTIKAGKKSKAIDVRPLEPVAGAGDKIVKLTLKPGTGYELGTTGTVTVKIKE